MKSPIRRLIDKIFDLPEWLVLGLVYIICLIPAFVAGAFASGPAINHPKPHPIRINTSGKPPPPQAQYIVRVKHDRKVPFEGELLLPENQTIAVNQEYIYTVKISGPDSAPPAIFTGSNARQVLIGGSVGVKLTCFEVSCTPLSSERLNLVKRSDTGYWEWRIIAHETGRARLYVIVTTYDQDTSNVLQEAGPIARTIEVRGTPTYYLTHGFNWVKALISLLGAGVFISIFVWTFKRLRRRRQSGSQTPERPVPPSITTTTEPSADSSAATRQGEEVATPENSASHQEPPSAELDPTLLYSPTYPVDKLRQNKPGSSRRGTS